MVRDTKRVDEKKLAEDHVTWYMGLMRHQLNVWMQVTERLMIENFEHGIKHGRELERQENYDKSSE